jgi:hypothetical protein
MAVPGILIDRFSSEGKIEEQWIDYDTLGFMQQIGAIPRPEKAADLAATERATHPPAPR